MKNKKKECTMYRFCSEAFRSWVLMAALLVPFGVLTSCSSDDDDSDAPAVGKNEDNSNLLINGEKWYDTGSSGYKCYFYNSNSAFMRDGTVIFVYLSSEEWDVTHWLTFSFSLRECTLPSDLSKGQVLDCDKALGTGLINLNNKQYNLGWKSGNVVFQSYDSQEQKVKLSFDKVVLQNDQQDAAYTLNGDIEIAYQETYYNY